MRVPLHDLVGVVSKLVLALVLAECLKEFAAKFRPNSSNYCYRLRRGPEKLENLKHMDPPSP